MWLEGRGGGRHGHDGRVGVVVLQMSGEAASEPTEPMEGTDDGG